ncbi:hypothetical protein COO60DRAFT_1544431 [Scenedesmus sp. NREL 46B-D3]|nr:hypothetical protein COO60DRAFT_1544431 [Scenedesmus sp. NREL 46B-D3]
MFCTVLLLITLHSTACTCSTCVVPTCLFACATCLGDRGWGSIILCFAFLLGCSTLALDFMHACNQIVLGLAVRCSRTQPCMHAKE